MKSKGTQVPAHVLQSGDLSPAAKLVWVVSQLHDTRETTKLESATGLTRHTVRKGLKQQATLDARGAGAVEHSASVASVSLPVDLLADRRVRTLGKILYGCLQFTTFRRSGGHFTYDALAKVTGVSIRTVKRAIADLKAAGWLGTTQQSQKAPIRFSLLDPGAARSQAEVAPARRRIVEAPFRGEALMREYLSLLVASNAYEDNAAPGFLVNPLSGERMELDRFYPPNVAFEYNGPQHYAATERFSADQVAKQRSRDFMKIGICVSLGIKLIVIHRQDLSLATMRSKLEGVLPLRDLDGHEPLIGYLEGVSRRHRRTGRG